MDDAFAYQGDSSGVRRWARDHGWSAASEQPPVVAEILGGAPVPTGPEHAVTEVLTGAFQGWDALAFTVGMTSAHGVVPKWAVTAVGRARQGDAFWLHPRRLEAFHLGGGGAEAEIADPQVSARWALRVDDTGDGTGAWPIDPGVARALLSSDDGDDLWATATAIAAVRVDGHRPALLEHHLHLLAGLAQADAARPSSGWTDPVGRG